MIRRSPGTRAAPIAILGAICVAVVVVGVLLEQVVLAQSAFKLARVRRELAGAEARNEALTLEVTKLQSPARIERYAHNALGMVAPTRVQYIVAAVGSAERRVARHDAPDDPGSGAAASLGSLLHMRAPE